MQLFRSILTLAIAFNILNSTFCEIISYDLIDTSHPLAKAVLITLNTSAYISLQYTPEISSNVACYTPWKQVAINEATNKYTTTINIFRLRPLSMYYLSIYMKSDVGDEAVLALSTNFTTSSSGYTFFDTGPYATITGSPTYEIIIFDAGLNYSTFNTTNLTDQYPSLSTSTLNFDFQGLIGIDKEGYVVWFLDQNATILLVQTQDESFNIVTLGASLSYVDAYGNNISSYSIPTCESLSTYSRLSHEVRVFNDEPYPIVAIRSYAVQSETTNYSVDTVISWDLNSSELEIIYNLYEHFDPSVYYGKLSYEQAHGKCGTEDLSLEDWTHMNSITAGNNDDYLLSVRSWSAVVSIAKDGSSMNWILSSETSSNFTIIDGINSTLGPNFYNQHHAWQHENGNIVMVDNGNSRDGCVTDGMVDFLFKSKEKINLITIS